MGKLKDYFKKNEVTILTQPELPSVTSNEFIIQEVEDIVESIEEEVDQLDEKQYAMIHLNAVIEYVSKSDSPLKSRIIRDLNNISELL